PRSLGRAQPCSRCWPCCSAPTRLVRSSTSSSESPAKRRLRSRARASVAWMALTFGVVQVAYSPLIVEWDQKAIDPLYAERIARLQARLSTAGNAPLVIVLGSSRAAVGIVGAPLEAHLAAPGGRRPVAFNFACGGCGPVMETITLQRLLRDGIRP